MSKKEFELFGILGYPLGHTLSPPMQEAGFEAIHRKAFYLVMELSPKSFRTAMKGLHQKNFQLSGFNVTVPYKETVIPYLDKLESSAKLIGAVNTVYRKGGKWIGANTDAYGFYEALNRETEFLPVGRNVLILGAGGSARAVVYALAQNRVRQITIVNRTKNRASKIIRDFSAKFRRTEFKAIDFSSEDLKETLNQSDLIVNATSVGLKPKDASLIPGKLIPSGKRKLFVDLIYRPAKTTFLREAAKKGHKTVNGLSMLLYQGAKSFECWTGKKAPIVMMEKALLEALKPKGV